MDLIATGRAGRGRTLRTAVVALVALAGVLVAMAPSSSLRREQAALETASGRIVHVIVTGAPGAQRDAVSAVVRAGGSVLHALPIVNGLDALVPEGSVPQIARTPGIRSVTPDAGVHLDSTPPDPTTWPGASPYTPKSYPGSLYNVAREINADNFWAAGYSGKGVGVALIDSGVAPVADITTNLVNGPDLSLDATGGAQDGIDAFGHGTHMAGIIAGKDPAAGTDPKKYGGLQPTVFLGIAPDAALVNVKVATADGSVDVSQVIAAIDWVVEHRNDPGMNIRVLNLSFGTDGLQDYTLDPLTYATEVAWRAGITVVVAAGNNGFSHPQLNDPATDPFVIAAGAQDQYGTVVTADDVIADFSSRGSLARRPDLMAPGRSIVSLRDPGSWIDTNYASAQVGADQFKGSGTSQAAAVLSGAVALVLSRYPNLTPDQVKAVLRVTGHPLKTSSGVQLESGMRTFDLSQVSAQVGNVLNGKVVSAQNFTPAGGLGSLDAARGSFHLVDPVTGSVLQGEIDVTGNAWDPASWSAAALDGRTWSGNAWLGRTWTGTSWSGRTWSGRTWTDSDFSGRTWTGSSWTGGSWTGRTWSGSSWSGRTWSSADLDPNASTGA